jgi:Family of unknown function (DUF7002)
LLNGFAFLWPDRERMERRRRAFGRPSQLVLAFDVAALLDRLEMEAFVSAINSGNARRKAVRRDRDTLVPYRTWLKQGWPGMRRTTGTDFQYRELGRRVDMARIQVSYSR